MKSVLIRLEGPLQSWGTQGRFKIRDTETEPSKSGVIGLVGAALGMPRDDAATLAQLAFLRMAVRVDREGTLLRDYHTVGGGDFRGQKHGVGGKEGVTVLTERHYLADAVFLAALGGDDHALVERIAAALADPVWPLFLGRKACVPSAPPFAGIVDDDPESASRKAPWPVPRWGDRAPARLRLVLEADAGRPRFDQPVSFQLYERGHARRFVRVEWMDGPSGTPP